MRLNEVWNPKQMNIVMVVATQEIIDKILGMVLMIDRRVTFAEPVNSTGISVVSILHGKIVSLKNIGKTCCAIANMLYS